MQAINLEFEVDRSSTLSALALIPSQAHCLLILAHGAGAGMRHANMESLAQALAERGVASFRFQFPYMERGQRMPDRQPVLLATVRAAVEAGAACAPALPLVAGGRSMGGRMFSLAQAQEPLTGITGLVFFGFPLHPAGKPDTVRATHLSKIQVPLLFLQGTRDRLADLEFIQPICKALGTGTQLTLFDGADHSFHVLKKSGVTDTQVLAAVATQVDQWTQTLIRSR